MKAATFSAVRFYEVRILMSVDDHGSAVPPDVVSMIYDAMNYVWDVHVLDVNEEELVLGPVKPDATPRKKQPQTQRKKQRG